MDFKFMEGNGRNLSKHIFNSYQKADYAIIQFKNDIKYTNRQISRIIEIKLEELDKMKGVFVFDKNGNLICSQINN